MNEGQRRHLTGVRFDGKESRNLQGKSARFKHRYWLILGYQRPSDQAGAKRRWAKEA